MRHPYDGSRPRPASCLLTEPLPQLQSALADRYTIEGELGRGGMGVVYRARDVRHGRAVALKVVRPELGSVLAAERFLREIQLAAKLQHPHIVPLYDSGEAAGVLFYVMPLVEGESLRTRLTRERQLALEDALQITREVADALGYAHSHDVVHRDIKPENILLAGGHALVVDFGIGRAITAAAGDRLTESGISVGTPAYMSPEQATGDTQLDGRSDLYSLACVLYEMLAGHPPFLGATAQEVLARHTLDPVPSLRTARSAVPAAVETAITRALAKVPADRFATAAQFAEALTVTAAPSPSRRRPLKRAAAAAATLLVLSVGAWLTLGPLSNAGELRAIAVLPCENLTRDATQEYVGDRWTEELIDRLVRVADLRIKSWPSVQRYRATRKPSQEIGRELGAGTLVRCRVAEASDTLRVSVQLIRATTDEVMWSKQYQRALSAPAINAVQSEVAEQAAAALGSSPSRSERARLDRPLTHNLEALRLYRLGRHFYGKLTVDALQRSVEYYDQAIGIDSTFAQAYVALAEVTAVVGDAELRLAREYYPQVARLVLKALEIDPLNAEAHSWLGDYLVSYTYDWPGAEREHRRALELNPNSVNARIWYGFDLLLAGHYDDAVVELGKAVELDPTYTLARLQLVQGLRFARQYTQAVEQVRAALEIDPDNPALHFQLGYVQLLLGQTDSAIAELEKGERLYGGWLGALSFLGYAYGVAGQREKAVQVLDKLLKRWKQRPFEPVAIARVYVGLRDNNEALNWLERAYQERSATLAYALGDPGFDALKDEPRFQALRKRVGLR